MSDIIEHEGGAVAKSQPKPELKAGGALGALIPQNVDEAFRLSDAIAKSGMGPRGMETMQIMTVIAKGMEVGFPPMQALSTIANINGRLSIYGDGLVAIARRGGNQISEKLEGNGDARVATCTVTRADTGEVITRAFSVSDAKRAKLWQKSGPWSQYPDRMLAARARAFAIRDGLSDKLFGLAVAEEAEDIPARNNAPASRDEPSESASRIMGKLGTAPTEDADVIEAEAHDEPTLDKDPADAFGDDFEPIDTQTPNQPEAA
jgi:hypothetical protein